MHILPDSSILTRDADEKVPLQIPNMPFPNNIATSASLLHFDLPSSNFYLPLPVCSKDGP